MESEINERALLYVSATRSKKEVLVTSKSPNDKPSGGYTIVKEGDIISRNFMVKHVGFSISRR
jgi:superfamily I DNA/RNA helicase